MEALSRVLTPPPRTLDHALVDALELPASRPPWLDDEDGLSTIYDRYREIAQHGELALAAVMMANEVMWKPGTEDAPSSVIYTFDPVLQDWPAHIRGIAAALYEFHESTATPPRDPWHRLLLDRLHSGFERTMHQRIPSDITKGFVAYESSCMLFRRHLPGGFLDRRFVPVLVLRRGPTPHPCAVVPSSLWPEGF
ncbi:MAG: hypothetical protein AAF602_26900 [Myxococcota bacterium]